MLVVENALRELEAAKARVVRDARAVELETKKKLVEALLPVLDNIDRTIAAARDQGESQAMIEGVELVRAQLEAVLRGYGAERLDATGEKFDPLVHEAIAVVPVVDDPGFVEDQIAPGYRYGESLLRPAKVVVGRAA